VPADFTMVPAVEQARCSSLGQSTRMQPSIAGRVRLVRVLEWTSMQWSSIRFPQLTLPAMVSVSSSGHFVVQNEIAA
jgi:hypothetical protein